MPDATPLWPSPLATSIEGRHGARRNGAVAASTESFGWGCQSRSGTLYRANGARTGRAAGDERGVPEGGLASVHGGGGHGDLGVQLHRDQGRHGPRATAAPGGAPLPVRELAGTGVRRTPGGAASMGGGLWPGPRCGGVRLAVHGDQARRADGDELSHLAIASVLHRALGGGVLE